jgi:hypothetical protein
MLYFVFNSIPSSCVNCHPEVQRRDVESSSKPSGIVKMKGDGNWFFRGISYALVGDQEQFEETQKNTFCCYWFFS